MDLLVAFFREKRRPSGFCSVVLFGGQDFRVLAKTARGRWETVNFCKRAPTQIPTTSLGSSWELPAAWASEPAGQWGALCSGFQGAGDKAGCFSGPGTHKGQVYWDSCHLALRGPAQARRPSCIPSLGLSPVPPFLGPCPEGQGVRSQSPSLRDPSCANVNSLDPPSVAQEEEATRERVAVLDLPSLAVPQPLVCWGQTEAQDMGLGDTHLILPNPFTLGLRGIYSLPNPHILDPTLRPSQHVCVHTHTHVQHVHTHTQRHKWVLSRPILPSSQPHSSTASCSTVLFFLCP